MGLTLPPSEMHKLELPIGGHEIIVSQSLFKAYRLPVFSENKCNKTVPIADIYIGVR